MKLNSFILLLCLIIIVISKEPKKQKITTEITITSTPEDEEGGNKSNEENEEEEEKKNRRQNGTKAEKEKEKEKSEKTKKKEEKEEEEHNQESSGESEQPETESLKEIKKKVISQDKILVLTAPYQDNEDFIITPLGLGTPVNFVPLQIDTTTYKTWVASVLNEESPETFSYDKKDSKTAEEKGEWDTVVDEEGTINGNVLFDKVNLGKFVLDRFKFIEAVEYEDEFKDFKNGKIGLGNCHYANRDGLEYCLIQQLKDKGLIERRIFSLREFSDTHGEIVIGDVTSSSKENDYPLLSVIDQDAYDDIEEDAFKMSWLTKISHVTFRESQSDNINNVFNNNIYLKYGLASFDSSCHYIEGPYTYIDEFEEKLFNKYYTNICRKVNDDGVYMFLCDKERFDKIGEDNKELSLVFVLDGNGFEVPIDSLFEQTREKDYEFLVHFKDFEQNIWNFGHPFFHHFTIIFDQDNQEIGIDGKNVYDLKDQTESELKKTGKYSNWWKYILFVLLGLLVLVGIFWLFRKWGIKQKLDNGVSPNLVDNESVDDLSFGPGIKA